MRVLSLIIQILCLVIAGTSAYGQQNARLSTQVEHQTSFYSRQTARVSSADLYTIRPNFLFTSVSLRIDSRTSFEGSYLVHRQDTFYLDADEHLPADISYQQANLVILMTSAEEIRFYPGNIRGAVTWSFFNAGGEKKSLDQAVRTQQTQRRAEACEEPSFVPAATWRAGLPVPSYQRRITTVEHIIVHHSATYNTLTNYENVVRNIYLFHTQDRGWSDIGYNYLIAQDGTIYEGRSAGSSDQDNDNVQGAHFCGQNSSTMGICLLGNYNTAEPSDTALASLVQLTAWKINKEGLNPRGEQDHPTNATLGTIAGHRDGCATECPGDNLYARLGEIRSTVEEYIAEGCQDSGPAVLVYPVPTKGYLTVTLPESLSFATAGMYDIRGRKVEIILREATRRSLQLDTRHLVEGVYVLRLSGPGWQERRRILVQ